MIGGIPDPPRKPAFVPETGITGTARAHSGPINAESYRITPANNPVLPKTSHVLSQCEIYTLPNRISLTSTRPFGAGEVDDGALPTLEASMALLDGLVQGRVVEVDRLEVADDGFLVVLDRGDDIVGAVSEKAALSGRTCPGDRSNAFVGANFHKTSYDLSSGPRAR